MMFNSLAFIVFFASIVFLYWALPHRFRLWVMLGASYLFYASEIPKYAILLASVTLVAYAASIKIEEEQDKRKKALVLAFGLIVLFGTLICMKYLNFFSFTLQAGLGLFGIDFKGFIWDIALPIGISFFTFQATSYMIDVYRGQMKAEKSLAGFALYISFFPQLVAGPIERTKSLLPQLFSEKKFNYEESVGGVGLILWGLFKKVVVADRVSSFVREVFTVPQGYNIYAYVMATLFFAFQIYCDFSGYTDIAMGAARILGIKLTENFRRPYLSKSIPEFWRRWHITLSTWFKDYVYIPLGGNRVSVPRWYLNLMIVFFIAGLWHGDSFTFLLWGGLHGIYMVSYAVLEKPGNELAEAVGLTKRKRLFDAVKILITFSLVCFAWMFFISSSVDNATYILTHLTARSGIGFFRVMGMSGFDAFGLALAFLSISVVIASDIILEYKPEILPWKNKKAVWAAYILLALAILLFGARTEAFIYFQF
jgi:alginate O-acetyltransferase complex protein AlgI